jgi:hypothetical protein
MINKEKAVAYSLSLFYFKTFYSSERSTKPCNCPIIFLRTFAKVKKKAFKFSICYILTFLQAIVTVLIGQIFNLVK